MPNPTPILLQETQGPRRRCAAIHTAAATERGDFEAAIGIFRTLADRARRSERRAWWVAGTSCAISLILAGGYFYFLPLKEKVPYLVMADAYTGTATVALTPADSFHLPPEALLHCLVVNLDLVLLVPTGVPAHRPEPVVPAATRLALAQAAADAEPVLVCSSVEVDRQGPSYMADTLEVLLKGDPGASLVLLLGADQYASLDQWHDPGRIRHLAAIAVAPLAGSEIGRAHV